MQATHSRPSGAPVILRPVSGRRISPLLLSACRGAACCARPCPRGRRLALTQEGRCDTCPSTLQRLVHIESPTPPHATHKRLDDLSGAAWIQSELGEGTFEPRQILSQHLVTAQNVPPDFRDHHRPRASKTPWTNARELRRVQKPGSNMFAGRPEAAAGTLRLRFFFRPAEFIHLRKIYARAAGSSTVGPRRLACLPSRRDFHRTLLDSRCCLLVPGPILSATFWSAELTPLNGPRMRRAGRLR